MTYEALTFGYDLLIKHQKDINKYFPSADQSIITIIIQKFTKIKSGLYGLPLFTVGIPSENRIKYLCIVHPIHCDKEYSIKERLLYYNNDNEYYTSKLRHYITITRRIIQYNLTYIVKVIKLFNLTLILPDNNCITPYCMYEMHPSYGDKLLVKYLEQEKVDYRESTFLRHPLVPYYYKNLHKLNLNELNNRIVYLYNNIYIK